MDAEALDRDATGDRMGPVGMWHLGGLCNGVGDVLAAGDLTGVAVFAVGF